jgi:hypothetical protein
VIFLNIQKFFSRSEDVYELQKRLEKAVLRELFRIYPDVDYLDREDLISSLEAGRRDCRSRD